MPILNVPNEVALKTVLIGTETDPGVAVTPTGRLLLDLTATPGVGAIRRSEDRTGGYDRTSTVRRQNADPSGTIGGGLTYQELAMLCKYSVKGGVTGSSDSETVPAYTYDFSPSFNADDIDTFTALFGVDGLPWQATGVRLNELTISGDATSQDADWQVSGPLYLKGVSRFEDGDFEGTTDAASTTTVITDSGTPAWTADELIGAYVFFDYGSGIGDVRQISDNDTTTFTLETALASAPDEGTAYYIAAQLPVISEADYDAIEFEGTKFYLDVYDADSSTLGTTEVSDRIVSFNVTQSLNLAYKRRAPGVIGRTGRGAREVSGTLRFEFDRWDEYVKWINNRPVSIRIEKTGPAIDADAGTNHVARIDIEKAAFDAWTEDADQNNMTVSLTFLALRNSPIWNPRVITNLATLP